MGASSSQQKQPEGKNSLLEDWETIDHLRDFNIVRHKQDGRIGEVRKFKLNPALDPAKELQIYARR